MKRTLLCLFLLIYSTISFSQSISDIVIERTAGDNSSIVSPMDSVFEVSCQFYLTDTVNIHKIYLLKATDRTLSNIINADTVAFLNISNADVSRRGHIITWTPGTESTILTRHYYAIKLEDAMGNITGPFIKQ